MLTFFLQKTTLATPKMLSRVIFARSFTPLSATSAMLWAKRTFLTSVPAGEPAAKPKAKAPVKKASSQATTTAKRATAPKKVVAQKKPAAKKPAPKKKLSPERVAAKEAAEKLVRSSMSVPEMQLHQDTHLVAIQSSWSSNSSRQSVPRRRSWLIVCRSRRMAISRCPASRTRIRPCPTLPFGGVL